MSAPPLPPHTIPDDADEERIVAALATSLLPARSSPHIQRVLDGASTRVFRLRWGATKRRAGQTLYLRILPEVGASFAPEATAHALARAQGARIPEVVYVEPCHSQLGRSVMVTTEIVGEPVWRRPFDDDTQRILLEAGRDLARINRIPVDGFGWVRRDAAAGDRLLGEHATQREFVLEHMETDLATLARHGLSSEEAGAIRAIVARCNGWLGGERAWLAHGDFDVTHIFQRDGRYTGIIDFGDMRGADSFYDLGHFQADDGEGLPAETTSSLLAGYNEIAPLPDDAERQVTLASLLITLRSLGRETTTHPGQPTDEWEWSVVRRELAALARLL